MVGNIIGTVANPVRCSARVGPLTLMLQPNMSSTPTGLRDNLGALSEKIIADVVVSTDYPKLNHDDTCSGIDFTAMRMLLSRSRPNPHTHPHLELKVSTAVRYQRSNLVRHTKRAYK